MEIEDGLSAEDESFAREQLTEFNLQFTGPLNFSEVRFSIRDDRGELVGALCGAVVWEWLHINVIWVDETCRGKGIGSQLLAQAEQQALESGASFVKLHTFSFQARPFYERYGYQVIGETRDFPVGHSQFLMFKPLNQ